MEASKKTTLKNDIYQAELIRINFKSTDNYIKGLFKVIKLMKEMRLQEVLWQDALGKEDFV